MDRIVLIRQGSGSPDVLPLETWQALSRPNVFAAPDDPLAERLREAGVTVSDLASASPAAVRGVPAARSSGAPALRLLAHVHGQVVPGAAAVAAELASLAVEHGEVVFILPADAAEELTKSTFERALQGGLEVEVVIGRAPTGHKLLDLVGVMARLRAPGGCPWDREQTHASLAKYLLDETYELLEAIEGSDPEHMAEELGDLLLQVVFHAVIAAEDGMFGVDDVADRLARKLVMRHPHVFGDVEVEGAHEVVANWEVIKDHEKGRSSVIEGVPEALPALAYAQKLFKRGARVGLPPSPPAQIEGPVDEEALGEMLFDLAAAARTAGVDAESALRRAARAFRDRLARAEAIARERGLALADLSQDELRALWAEAKL